MNDALKRIALLLLLSLLLYNQSGYWLLYTCTRYHLKANMEAQLKKELPDSLLTVIPYAEHRSELRWEEAGRELSWHNQLYDVVRIITVQDKKILLCLADDREEQLVRQLCNVYGKSTERKAPAFNGKIADDFPLPASPPLPVIHITRIQSFVFYRVALPQQSATVTVPPPRHCLA